MGTRKVCQRQQQFQAFRMSSARVSISQNLWMVFLSFFIYKHANIVINRRKSKSLMLEMLVMPTLPRRQSIREDVQQACLWTLLSHISWPPFVNTKQVSLYLEKRLGGYWPISGNGILYWVELSDWARLGHLVGHWRCPQAAVAWVK